MSLLACQLALSHCFFSIPWLLCMLQTLTGALDRLQGRLASTGMQQQAQAVAEAKGSVVGAVSEAAEGVKNFVQASVHVRHWAGGSVEVATPSHACIGDCG